MKRRDWFNFSPEGAALLFVALAIWSAMIWGIAHQQARRINATEYALGNSAEQTRRGIVAGCAHLDIDREYVACVTEQLLNGRLDQRAELELQAQTRIADWTIILATVSILQTLVGAVGLVMIFRTFDKTSVQAHAAQRAVAKASVANALTRSNAVWQNRAYVSVERLKIELHPDPNGKLAAASFTPILINAGATPAKLGSISHSPLLIPADRPKAKYLFQALNIFMSPWEPE